MTDSRSQHPTEQAFLEDNIATVAFHLGQPGAKLNVSHDKGALAVDSGEVLKEISRRLSAPAVSMGGEPVAWRFRSTPDHWWSFTSDKAVADAVNAGAEPDEELEPLYAASPPSNTAAVKMAIEALEDARFWFHPADNSRTAINARKKVEVARATLRGLGERNG